MKVEPHHIETAYRKLKRLVYYDKTDLHLRNRLSEFECSSGFRTRLNNVARVANSKSPLKSKAFAQWVDEISFRVLPKTISKPNHSYPSSDGNSGKYISNVTSSDKTIVEKVNYFFDGPIELHLLAVLWIMFEGKYLDEGFGRECYGSRLAPQVKEENDRTADLFCKYHKMYTSWRDTGIQRAKKLLVEEKKSVCILGLDVQEYFYWIDVDFMEIATSVEYWRSRTLSKPISPSAPSNLLICLHAIHTKYREVVYPLAKKTHQFEKTGTNGIPIGLCSSYLLANWYLVPFDKDIKRIIRPAYYGRYVDDILLVVESVDNPELNDSPLNSFMDEWLVSNGLLAPPENNRYEILRPGGLYLQQSKCILQYFDIDHSIAGLEKFQKKLEENRSDFLLLPVEEEGGSIEDVAYELMYEGSVNKFRSVRGLAENRYELAKSLTRQTILHVLTDDPPDHQTSLGLRRFFKGTNAIQFFDLWERVFTYFTIAGDRQAAYQFDRRLGAEVRKIISTENENLTELLQENLHAHLRLSQALSNALTIDLDMPAETSLDASSIFFRKSNMLRHHFVRLPLLNYTSFAGALTTRVTKEQNSWDKNKVKFTPRFLNFDECLLLVSTEALDVPRMKITSEAKTIYKLANRHPIEQVEWEAISIDSENEDAQV
jgi:hypothetical protein